MKVYGNINTEGNSEISTTPESPVISSNTLTVDCSKGNIFVINHNANINTFNVINPQDGQAIAIIFQEASAGLTITWPSNFFFLGSNVIDTTSGQINQVWAIYSATLSEWVVTLESNLSGSNVSGSDTQVQFNDGGLFGASGNFTYDYTHGTLSLTPVTGTSFVLNLNSSSASGGSVLDFIAPTNIFTTGLGLNMRFDDVTGILGYIGFETANSNNLAMVMQNTKAGGEVDLITTSGQLQLDQHGQVNISPPTGGYYNLQLTNNDYNLYMQPNASNHGTSAYFSDSHTSVYGWQLDAGVTTSGEFTIQRMGVSPVVAAAYNQNGAWKANGSYGSSGNLLVSGGTAGPPSWSGSVSTSSITTPGSDKEILFNDGGNWGAVSFFTFDKTSATITIGIIGTGLYGLKGADSSTAGTQGGNILVSAGSATGTTASSGGTLELFGGNGYGSGKTSGDVWVYAGAANGGANGGKVLLLGGVASGTGNAGNVQLQAGNATGSGTNGTILFTSANGTNTIINGVGAWSFSGSNGSSGQVLQSNGSGGAPSWTTIATSTTLTGDVTGTGTGTVPTTLATVNGTVGTFGSRTAIPVVTVNGKGLVTNVSTASNAPAYEAQTATANQTVFNTTVNTSANGSGLTYLQVYVNGVYQQEGASKAYTVTGANQITFNAGLSLNSDVAFISYT